MSYNNFLQYKVKRLRLRLDPRNSNEEENKRNYEYAKMALGARKENLSEERAQEKEMFTRRGFFILAVIVVTFIFFGWALHLGKGDIVMEFVKMCLYTSLGAFGSYNLGKAKGKREVEENLEE